MSDTQDVERVAKAIYAAARSRSRAEVEQHVFPGDQVEDTIRSCLSSSDREAAIVMFCLIDDIASDFFRRRLTGPVPNGANEAFFSGNGILSSAHNKLTLLLGLEWISENTYRDTSFMLKTRNLFAHHVDKTSFNEAPVRDFIENLSAAEVDIISGTADVYTFSTDLDVRTKFFVRSISCVYNLMTDLVTIQAGYNNKVDPKSILGSFDEHPENVRRLLIGEAKMIIEAFIKSGHLLAIKGLPAKK